MMRGALAALPWDTRYTFGRWTSQGLRLDLVDGYVLVTNELLIKGKYGLRSPKELELKRGGSLVLSICAFEARNTQKAEERFQRFTDSLIYPTGMSHTNDGCNVYSHGVPPS